MRSSSQCKKCALSASAAADLILMKVVVDANADLVPDPSEIGTHNRESEDDYLIALARMHDAEFIVSGDRDLLEWEEQRPPVVTPVVFTTLMPGHSTSETG